MYAVFKNDKRVSKYYPYRIQAVIHAFEHRLVVTSRRYGLFFDCEIKHIKDKE